MARSLKTLQSQAEKRGVRIPTKPTLDRYGWSLREWLQLLSEQNWTCPVCFKFPKLGHFVTDHEHVRGWKRMEPDERKRYVRGLTCWACNKFLLGRNVTVESSRNVEAYLVAYERRRDA